MISPRLMVQTVLDFYLDPTSSATSLLAVLTKKDGENKYLIPCLTKTELQSIAITSSAIEIISNTIIVMVLSTLVYLFPPTSNFNPIYKQR